ncbi:histidine kinase famiy protein [Microvirga sp. 17 mud 1-3]|uniref:histidine kinase famiy protein n=1 Tax=Microvirga sp. 17 mud 1-3 TaxID=2082949 RepID=UPI000D6C14BA|nr:histidine kinase famiy protein [Microvirga sp. 17 mud 1-3]AWM86982.1 hybrid sensor histidine kinase/response regulator [Microvirga sp. 17 mud 1-3]
MSENETPSRVENDPPLPDVEGEGQSVGRPAAGEHEHVSYNPTGGPGFHHWQEATITQPGLGERGNVFFAAIEMTRMPMILTDPNLPDNPVVFANRAFQDLTGYTEEEVLGRNCRFLQGSNTDQTAVAELREAISERRAVSVELLNYRRDGTPFWNACFVGPVFDKRGRLLYFFASQLDVTRRRTSEQAFRQAQKMESIGQLTAGLAHDFNNLLQVVSGNLELALSRTDDESLRRPLENASRAAERGSKLTKQLLAFARKTRLEAKPTNLNNLILEFGEMLENSVGPQIEVQLNLRSRVPPALVDPVHLEMAVLNVLINARDAMPKGGCVTISTSKVHLNGNAPAHHLPPGDYVALSITDEGDGMPPHVLERATEPFFTTKGQGKGTGLGLAMVHGFVQQSLGRLEIESERDKGTTIRMLFPAAEAQAAAAAQPSRKPPAPTEPRGQAETILVVEDSHDVLELAREHLTTLGYNVLVAHDADEALAVLERADGQIDLLFTDLVMPGSMNGLALADVVRERAPGVGILLTTGYNDDLLSENRGTAGADVLGKPYRRLELADRVRAALNNRGKERRVLPKAPSRGPRHEG